MFPTHVGMNRCALGWTVKRTNVPHTRGDEPYTQKHRLVKGLHVPHTRGDEPYLIVLRVAGELMFPTHVGMNRGASFTRTGIVNVPHTRGDEPPSWFANFFRLQCSPHTWG